MKPTLDLNAQVSIKPVAAGLKVRGSLDTNFFPRRFSGLMGGEALPKGASCFSDPSVYTLLSIILSSWEAMSTYLPKPFLR